MSNDELVTQNLALVGHIVRETMGRVPSHVSRDDLTSAGMLALVQAAQSYQEERGVPFARYAATRIRGAVLDELRGLDWASRSVRRRARELEATRATLTSTLGRAPSTAELARAAGLREEEVAANQGDVARSQVFSLDGAGDFTLADQLVSRLPRPDESLLGREEMEYLVDAIAELPERLRHVVEQYFLAERPMAEIAETLGVTESRVSQMRAEALVLLREALHRLLSPELTSEAAEKKNGCAARRRDAYVAAVAARHAAAARPQLPAVAPATALDASA